MSADWIEVSTTVASVLLAAAAVMAIVRLLRGPQLLDRVVALDVIAAVVVAQAIVAGMRTGEAVLIDVGLAIALVSFLATIAAAHFVEERGDHE